MLRAQSLRPWLLATLALVGPVASSAHAALSVTVLNSTTSAGGTGSFDVVLSNTNATGGTSYAVSGFSVELRVAANSGVLFTAASGNTASPYIFGTVQQLPLASGFPTTDFIASDSDFTAPYTVTVVPGSTFGLEHVTYTVAAGAAAGPITVAIIGNGSTTQVDDINGTPFPGTTTTNGTITVTPAATVPEPASAVLALLGLVGTAGFAAVRSARRHLGPQSMLG